MSFILAEKADPQRRVGAAGKGARIVSPREAAVRAYGRWLRRHSRIDAAAQWALERWSWGVLDRALFLELLFGLVRWHGRLEWIVGQLGGSGVRDDPRVYAAAALGIYQLLFLDRVPAYAAVDTSVELARRAGGPEAAGWVNAVLRRVSQQREQWRDALPDGDRLLQAAVRHSHPPWMVARWDRWMPGQVLKEFLSWNNRRPRVHLRVNRQQAGIEAVATQLEERGVRFSRSRFDPFFLELTQPGDPGQLEPVRAGLATVQDVSQGLVSYLVSPQPGERILDLCAAPGGKTTHLAELCPECRITATDKSDERLKLVELSVARCRLDGVEIVPYDRVLSSRGRYDAVLVDAPCTGTGVLARRPDLRWRRGPDDIPRMAAVQRQLLRYASNRLAPGGRIIYSTCSVEPEENEGLIQQFLEETRGFRVVPAQRWLPSSLVDKDGRLRLLGPEIEGDGVFAVRLERG